MGLFLLVLLNLRDLPFHNIPGYRLWLLILLEINLVFRVLLDVLLDLVGGKLYALETLGSFGLEDAPTYDY